LIFRWCQDFLWTMLPGSKSTEVYGFPTPNYFWIRIGHVISQRAQLYYSVTLGNEVSIIYIETVSMIKNRLNLYSLCYETRGNGGSRPWNLNIIEPSRTLIDLPYLTQRCWRFVDNLAFPIQTTSPPLGMSCQGKYRPNSRLVPWPRNFFTCDGVVEDDPSTILY
jgi:hypothetical protein